ncbi:hypothetical protein DSO57_1017622 [Entomophthora muscae]|uniref:Uncharacterized protein n=1 Tax=Entomophthora muscae TaxID=34485 RepID=A0ACC2RVU2_9FUNG|nr:hypothetical protein DSO57_1017622 [Entomophthora muscae]
MDNWRSNLPMVEFTYNGTPHMSTQASPFFANVRYNLLSNMGPRIVSNVKSANNQATALKQAYQELQVTLSAAVTTYKEYTDIKRQEGPTYQKSDQVMVDSRQSFRVAPKIYSEASQAP